MASVLIRLVERLHLYSAWWKQKRQSTKTVESIGNLFGKWDLAWKYHQFCSMGCPSRILEYDFHIKEKRRFGLETDSTDCSNLRRRDIYLALFPCTNFNDCGADDQTQHFRFWSFGITDNCSVTTIYRR